MSQPLELIVITDTPSPAIEEAAAEVVDAADFPTRVTVTDKEILKTGVMQDGSPIPDYALVWVNGNVDGSSQIGQVGKLVGRRHDIYAILQMDLADGDEAVRKGMDPDEILPHFIVTPSEIDLLSDTNYDPILLKRYFNQIQQDRKDATLDPVDIVVYNDKPVLIRSFRHIEDSVADVMEDLGWDYNLQRVGERLLPEGMVSDTERVPENAVVYVHGNLGTNYVNVGHAARLAEQRPDLRFIMYVDVRYASPRFFEDQADLALVEDGLMADFTPESPIVISSHNPLIFMSGNDDGRGMILRNRDFKSYMTKLQALRGEE